MKINDRWLYHYLLEINLSEPMAKTINMLTLFLITIIVLLIIDFASRKVIVAFVSRLSERSKTKFDDLLVSNKVPNNLAHAVAILIAFELTPIIFSDFPYWESIMEKALKIFGIVLILWIARSALNTIKDYFKMLPKFKDKPIDSYIQVFMIFAWFAGFVFTFSVITNQPVWSFLVTLGTASAVIILIFRDTILGFVASIQVSINDIVRIGDWITFEKYGADGNVIEINLATVKIQNFDHTITTIPTYALISDSFKNWRGMQDSEGRRIKRSVLIKVESIKYLTQQDIEKLKKIQLITGYLKRRQQKINEFNQEKKIDKQLLINGRNMTNLGVFRKYIELYVAQHSAIHKELMLMVRQLPLTSQGIPVEIYTFSKDKRWENYEYIMADIFDHILASVPYFDLECFELPSTGKSVFPKKQNSI